MADTTLMNRKYVVHLLAAVLFGVLCTHSVFAGTATPDAAFYTTDSTDSAAANPEPYLVREYDIGRPGTLKIFTVGGDIEVEASSSYKKVRIELYVDRGFAFWSNSKNLDNYRITTLKRDNEVVASVEQKKRESSFFGDRMNFSFRVYIPIEMSNNLKTLGGDVSLRNAQGTQTIKTGGGSITAKKINGRLEAYTAGGRY
ncbi:MAG: hypothetical protein U5J63_00795 [Fodinibius sp.]|nr:hypothetical protein [Fodinibius sp.]